MTSRSSVDQTRGRSDGGGRHRTLRVVQHDRGGRAGQEPVPKLERGEREEAAKAAMTIVEVIPQQEWVIYRFPIGGSEISEHDSGRFIEKIINSLMKGHFVYMTGQDPVVVEGFSNAFPGKKVSNQSLRQHRAASFCAGVKAHLHDAPKSYVKLIRSCSAAPAGQYVGPNTTRSERAMNRSVRIRRLAADKFQYQEGGKSYPYNPEYGPSRDHCAVYSSSIARDVLGRVYPNNAHCSCLVTPDNPQNNCVRDCLQQKMWSLLANARQNRQPGDPPIDMTQACLLIWKDHRECYHDCGCTRAFIDYLAFNAVCNIALPSAIDSAAINLLNRCTPASPDDKYAPVR